MFEPNSNKDKSTDNSSQVVNSNPYQDSVELQLSKLSHQIESLEQIISQMPSSLENDPQTLSAVILTYFSIMNTKPKTNHDK